ncbi:MAG: nucleotidyltransferase domain-containing protein [Chitinispirillia bacterium]|nr:nucleotidyltransferase domain-containing protein [Chitinispirillia bacterium]
MTEAVKNELDRIVDTLVETGIVTKIILFGSHARGEETPESDIDLCVLLPIEDNSPSFSNTELNLRTKLINVQKRPLDFLAYNQRDFLTWAERPRSFEHSIMEEGVVLYG